MKNQIDKSVNAIGKPIKSIAFIGNHLPRQCGIATFTRNLLKSISTSAPQTDCWAVAMNDQLKSYDYPSVVRLQIQQNDFKDYLQTANRLNSQPIDIVCVQHEYGIYGGERGGFIIELIKRLRAPIVTTLHTLLKKPSEIERDIIINLAKYSSRLIVMSQSAAKILRETYQVAPEKIALIHHGIPDVPFIESDHFKKRFNLSDKKVLLTFGLLSPDKGIETVIEALPEIVKAFPDAVYLLVGATHPHFKSEHGEDYREILLSRAKQLGVDKHLISHNRFVSDEELLEFIGAADVYITPYLNKAQITSGTLSYALGMGKAVVSTPYWHAQELLAEGRGCLFPFKDHASLSSCVIELFANPEKLQHIQHLAYEYGRQMTWPSVAKGYLKVFSEVQESHSKKQPVVTRIDSVTLRHQPLPEVKFDHLHRLTDNVGILQHSKFSIPNRNHGYCVDDNARALIVAVSGLKFQPGNKPLSELIFTYLSFLKHAFNKQNGRFRNFMSYDRCWLEEKGSQDSHGRALWGLGVMSAAAGNSDQVKHAIHLFKLAVNTALTLTHPRAMAFSIIGIHAYLSVNHDPLVDDINRSLSIKLLNLFNNGRPGWHWYEERLTYENARLPQALLLSGHRFQIKEMSASGLRTLSWLKDIQLDTSGNYFSAVGNKGWYQQGQIKASFDQQPIEAAAMIDACIDAYKITGEEEWSHFAQRCLHWFHGYNELRLSLYDQESCGCADGLQPDSVNQNKGAESTLCWLMALLGIYQLRGINSAEEAIQATRLEAAIAKESD